MLASKLSRRSTFLLLNLLAAACGDDKPSAVSPPAAVCQRLDDCNLLSPGTSVVDCTSVATDCLGARRQSERDDWNLLASDCLRLSSCGNFVRCFEELAYCGPLPAEPDAGDLDAGRPDPRKPDSGEHDAGKPDSGEPKPEPDAGERDAGKPDPVKPTPERDAGEHEPEPRLVEGLIQPPFLYSAFGGRTQFQVTPSVPTARPDTTASDPILADSLVWSVNEAHVKLEPFPSLPGAVLLSTLRSGNTTIKVTGTTLSGQKVRGEATLNVDLVTPNEADAGETAYSAARMIAWTSPEMGQPGEGPCGLPVTVELPTSSTCANCHNDTSSTLSIEYTPTQTSGYSDAQLVALFTTGMRPAGAPFNSPFLRSAPMPDCIFTQFHTAELTEQERKGVVAKLRSIPPKVREEIDFGRLAQQARNP